MAGGGALGKPERQRRGKQSKRKKKKRIGFHLDMTPLVDITFLLLTFFMFTTTMLKPQIMEMSMPPEISKQVEVKASLLLTIMLTDEGKVYWYAGVLNETLFPNNKPKLVEINQIGGLAVKENLRPEVKNELITSFKVGMYAKYEKVIEVLDQLNLAEGEIITKIYPDVRKRKFTISPILDKDLEDLKKAEV